MSEVLGRKSDFEQQTIFTSISEEWIKHEAPVIYRRFVHQEISMCLDQPRGGKTPCSAIQK